MSKKASSTATPATIVIVKESSSTFEMESVELMHRDSTKCYEVIMPLKKTNMIKDLYMFHKYESISDSLDYKLEDDGNSGQCKVHIKEFIEERIQRVNKLHPGVCCDPLQKKWKDINSDLREMIAWCAKNCK